MKRVINPVYLQIVMKAYRFEGGGAGGDGVRNEI